MLNNAKPTVTHLDVENFGPIAEASIDFEDLTLLTGPYNTGKTYFSTLACLLSKVTNYACQNIPIFEIFSKHKIYGVFTGERLKEILERHYDEVAELARNNLQRSLQDVLLRELSQYFAITSPSELIKHESKSAYVRMLSKIMDADCLEVEFEICRLGKGVELKNVILSDKAVRKVLERVDTVSSDGRALTISYGRGFPFLEPLYIPAERLFVLSNIYSLIDIIIETHGSRALGLEIAQRSVFERFRGMMRPLLLDYIRNLVSELKGRTGIKTKKPFISYEDVLDLIGGDMRFDEKTFTAFYTPRGGPEIPLARASSGIAQLVSLLLSLPIEKEGLQSKSLIVVEEPEINLHANHQLKVASLLAKISNHTHLLVTTHSEYILQKLAHLWAKGEMQSFRAYFLDPESRTSFEIKAKKKTGEIELIKTINEAVAALADEALELYEGGR